MRRVATVAAAMLTLSGTTLTAANAGEGDLVRQVQAVTDADVVVGGGGIKDVLAGGERLPGVGGLADLPGFQQTWPPAGFALTSIQWSMGPGDAVPTFTPPNPLTSHPTNWSCTTSVTGTFAHASCMPTSAPDPGTVGWSCYDPFVVVDLTNGAGDDANSLVGSSHCGTTYATCVAATGITVAAGGLSSSVIDISSAKFGIGTPAAHCQHAAFPAQPAPLECDADFAGVKPTATWTVRCAPIDP